MLWGGRCESFVGRTSANRLSEGRAPVRRVLTELGRFVLDVGKGYVAERALEPVLEPTWQLLKSVLLPRWDPASDAVRLNLREHIQRERAKDEEFTVRLQRSLSSGEGEALLASFVTHAAQATTEERMHMLAAAAAGVFVPDLDSEMRSRVTRAVAQLEPADVIRLRGVAERRGLEGSSKSIDVTLGTSRGVLVASGCMAVLQEDEELGHRLAEAARRGSTPKLRTHARVTIVGHAVLRALDEWRSSEATTDQPT